MKMVFVGICIIALRWSLPRLRVDQLTSLSWKYLTPIAILCLFGTSIWVLL